MFIKRSWTLLDVVIGAGHPQVISEPPIPVPVKICTYNKGTGYPDLG
jgi:hypothetical protein